VGVLLMHDQHVLLNLRILPPEAGRSGIVGGKLDYLESLEQCAIREACAELGVDIVIQSLLCVTEHRLPDEHQDWISPAFLAQIFGGRQRTASRPKRKMSLGSRSMTCL
jgi:8-oxo-dGTP diphosphatase